MYGYRVELSLDSRFVRNLIHDKKVQPLNLIFYLTKFAISALVLFGAINYFEIPPLGLIIGLSNILLAWLSTQSSTP